jgi:FtsH-binding integral membrane protein
LAAFTFLEGYLLSYVGFYKREAVLTAAILTIAVTVGLTFYAFTTETDMTVNGSMLFIFGSVFIGLVIVGMFVQSTFLSIIISSVGCVLFGFYIVYDVQLILGTKAEQFSLDDYIVAALSLYIDVINLFIQILELVSLLFGENNS